jgi:putative intracellular protease/amidase
VTTDKGVPLELGAVLFEGFELLDIYGPLEMFGGLDERIRILMLAEAVGAVRSGQGPAGLADASLLEARKLDVLLIPGGKGARREVANSRFIEALVRQAQSARYVAAICTGSALLARSGLLNGRRATSNKRAFEWAMSQGPAVQWVPKARWVEDGKFFSSSGVSAGMDMALGLIARLFDRDTSITIAQCAEYEWHEDDTWDPFAKIF